MLYSASVLLSIFFALILKGIFWGGIWTCFLHFSCSSLNVFLGKESPDGFRFSDFYVLLIVQVGNDTRKYVNEWRIGMFVVYRQRLVEVLEHLDECTLTVYKKKF